METFIVRVWTPSPDLTDEITALELHGNVERVGSREQVAFGTTAQLLEILETALQPRTETDAGTFKRS